MTPPIPTSLELGLDADAQQVDQLAREILRDNYVHFQLDQIELSERLADGSVSVTCRLSRSGSGEHRDIEGKGVGLVDALFDGMMKTFADEYPSLKTITVADFRVESGFDGTHGRRSDAKAVATLRIVNSAEKEFTFRSATPSVTRSSVRAALDALTFFINSERAYVQLHVALQDAKARRRSDLVERYQAQMGTLVHATSYSEVIERIRKEDEA